MNIANIQALWWLEAGSVETGHQVSPVVAAVWRDLQVGAGVSAPRVSERSTGHEPHREADL